MMAQQWMLRHSAMCAAMAVIIVIFLLVPASFRLFAAGMMLGLSVGWFVRGL